MENKTKNGTSGHHQSATKSGISATISGHCGKDVRQHLKPGYTRRATPIPKSAGSVRNQDSRPKVLQKLLKRIDIEEKLKRPESAPDVVQTSKKEVADVSQKKPNENIHNNNTSTMLTDSSRADVSKYDKEEVRKKCDPVMLKWLQDLNLKDVEKYAIIFKEHEIDLEALQLMNEKQLKSVGILAVGPLTKIMHGIRQLRKNEQNKTDRSQKKPKETKTPGRKPFGTEINKPSAKTSVLRQTNTRTAKKPGSAKVMTARSTQQQQHMSIKSDKGLTSNTEGEMLLKICQKNEQILNIF